MWILLIAFTFFVPVNNKYLHNHQYLFRPFGCNWTS